MGWHDLCVKQFKVQKEAYCSEDKELTKAEYTALVCTAEQKKNERLSLVVQTICGTGIRVSELHSITVEAVRRGVKRTCIIDGRVPHSILIELLSNEGIGTQFV